MASPRYRAADKLKDKVALVTGGDSGIGRAVAYLYAREGADVAITYLPPEQSDAEETRTAIENEGRRCLLLVGDLIDPDFCRDAVARTVKEFGKLDIVVSNAGWQNRKYELSEVTDEELERTFQVNVYGYLRLIRAAVPHLHPGASIIASGSETGLHGSPALPDYSATKGAIHAMTRSLANALRDKGIRVNCVAPGPVWTPFNIADQGTTPEQVATFGQELGSSPMGRPAQPEEIAPSYVFFASDADSSYITGVVLPAMG